MPIPRNEIKAEYTRFFTFFKLQLRLPFSSTQFAVDNKEIGRFNYGIIHISVFRPEEWYFSILEMHLKNDEC